MEMERYCQIRRGYERREKSSEFLEGTHGEKGGMHIG